MTICLKMRVTICLRCAWITVKMYERSPRAISWQAVGDPATICLPSRLSRVRVPSPAPSSEPSLYWLTRGRFVASKRCESQQAGGFMLRKKVYSDILPHFGVTSCLARRDILPWRGRNILPSQLRDILPRPPLTPCLPHGAPQAPKEAQRDVLKRPTWPKKRTQRTGHTAPIRIYTNQRAGRKLAQGNRGPRNGPARQTGRPD